MNKNVPAPVLIGEIARTYETGIPHPLDQKYNLRCGGGGEESGGSPVTSPLLMPGSAVLFMAPLGCGRHNSLASLIRGQKDRIWYVRLEERDIVTGQNLKRAKEALLEMIHTCQPKPQVIFLCVTCVDMLLASDYRALGAQIESETGVRIGHSLMCPMLNESKTPEPVRTWNAFGELIRADKNAPKEKHINLIGNYRRPDASSDLVQLLDEAGLTVNHFVGCESLEEVDRMSQASYALAYNDAGLQACRNMDKRYCIPYTQVRTSFDPDVIHRNYQVISQLIGAEIDDSQWYSKTKARIAEVVALCAGKSVAVGESLDNNPFQAAVDLCKLGFSVKAVFSRFVKPEYRTSIEWLHTNHPEIKVYFSSHPGMYHYPEQPDHFDLAFGLDSDYTKTDKTILTVLGGERQPDYRSILEFLDRVEKCLKGDVTTGRSIASLFTGSSQQVIGYTGKNPKHWGHYTSHIGGKE